MKILLTSTSFQDTPGEHQELLYGQGFEIDTLRGPLKKEVLLPIVQQYDGIVCGDDEYDAEVIELAANGKLKVLSKYGIGLDKIDLQAAKKFNIPVTNCPGVNKVTVAEHVFALLLTFSKNIIEEHTVTQASKWKRLTGTELYGKTIGVIGLGNIGKEVAKRALAFGMQVVGYDKFIDRNFVKEHNIKVANSFDEVFAKADILSLHVFLDSETQDLINLKTIAKMKKGVIIVNTARGGLIDESDMCAGLRSGQVGGFLTDVLVEEPMSINHPFLEFDNVIITPHIGSRTFESVERQGLMAVNNLLNHLK